MQDPDTFTIIAGVTAAILVIFFRALALCHIHLDNEEDQDRMLLYAVDLAAMIVLTDSKADLPIISDITLTNRW